MQSSTFHAWSVGLVRRPWLVTLATVVVCANFAAHAAGALVDAQYLVAAPEPRPRAAVIRAPRPRVRPDPGQLVERDMFCSQCAPGVAPDPAASVALPQATLIATGLGREPYATLTIAGTAVQGAWSIGDAIPGLGRLDRITPTWIEIRDGAGRQGRLSLREAAAGRAPDTAMPGTAPAAPWARRIDRIDDQTYEVDRSLVRELVTGMTRPGGVRPVPVLDHGEIAGIKLYGVAGDSIPAAVGLTSGDTLTAINGTPIKSLQQLFDLYAGLDQLSSVEVAGTRRGKPLVRVLRLR